MKKRVELSIILLNYNNWEYTRDCIRSVLENTLCSFEIIVLDNKSEKDELSILKKTFRNIDSIVWIQSEQNLGFSKGNNFAVTFANGKFISILNNDAIVTKNWDLAPLKHLRSQANIAIVQPKIRSLTRPQYFDYAGGGGGYMDLFCYTFTRGRIIFSLEEDIGQYDDVVDIFWASGACFFITKKRYEEFGGFNEDFFSYVEEVDLCWRVLKKGYRIICEPRSLIYHKNGATNHRDLPRKITNLHRNNLMLILLHLSWKKLLYVLPGHVVFDFLSIVLYILQRNYSYTISVVKAYYWWIGKIPYIVKHRIPTPQNNRADSLIFKRSIVIDYYLLRRKRFSEIFSIQLSKGKILYFGDLNRKPNARSSFIGLVSIVVFSLVYRLPSLLMPLSRDEGAYAYIASRLLHGELPYVHYFDHKPPLVYLIYIIPVVFHPGSFFVIRLFSLLYFAVIVLMSMLFVKKYFSLSASILSGSVLTILSSAYFYQGLEFNTETLMYLPMLLAFFLMYSYRKNRNDSVLVVLSLLNGISFMIKQVSITNTILVFLILVFAFRQRSSYKQLGKFVLIYVSSFLLPFFLLFIFYSTQGKLSDFMNTAFFYNAHYVANGLRPSDISGFSYLPTGFRYLAWFFSMPPYLFLLSLGTIALGVLSIKTIKEREMLGYVLLWVFASHMGAKILGGRDAPHYFLPYIYGLSLIIGILLSKVQKSRKNLMKFPFVAIIGFIVLVIAYQSLVVNLHGGQAILTATYDDQGIVFFDAYAAGTYLQKIGRDTDAIAILGSEPELYYYAQKVSASHYIYTFPLGSITNGHKQYVKQIREKNPLFLIQPVLTQGEDDQNDQATLLKTDQYLFKKSIGKSYRIYEKI